MLPSHTSQPFTCHVLAVMHITISLPSEPLLLVVMHCRCVRSRSSSSPPGGVPPPPPSPLLSSSPPLPRQCVVGGCGATQTAPPPRHSPLTTQGMRAGDQAGGRRRTPRRLLPHLPQRTPGATCSIYRVEGGGVKGIDSQFRLAGWWCSQSLQDEATFRRFPAVYDNWESDEDA